MEYLIPLTKGKKAHYAVMGVPYCGNRMLPLERYRIAEDIGGHELCQTCQSKYSSQELRLVRPDVMCRCFGRVNTGAETLEYGFYCNQCGEFWLFESKLTPLPDLLESGDPF